jgi:hypothetical protein
VRKLAILGWLLCLVPVVGHAQKPSLEVRYVEADDRACAAARGAEFKEEWVKELNEILPAYRKLWQAKGAAMSASVTKLTKRDLPLGPVRLTLCDTPSQSFGGASVNMRFVLRSFTTNPIPLRYKVDTAFHESLHPFIAQHAPRTSPLVAAHRSESACVTNHLHLLALQKAVLLDIGDGATLKQLIEIDSQLPSGCYKRAWELVNATDGTYKRYVAELTRKSEMFK